MNGGWRELSLGIYGVDFSDCHNGLRYVAGVKGQEVPISFIWKKVRLPTLQSPSSKVLHVFCTGLKIDLHWPRLYLGSRIPRYSSIVCGTDGYDSMTMKSPSNTERLPKFMAGSL